MLFGLRLRCCGHVITSAESFFGTTGGYSKSVAPSIRCLQFQSVPMGGCPHPHCKILRVPHFSRFLREVGPFTCSLVTDLTQTSVVRFPGAQRSEAVLWQRRPALHHRQLLPAPAVAREPGASRFIPE